MVTLKDSAVAKVKDLLKAANKSDDYGLRVAIQGGGCSGFRYNLTFDNQVNATDIVEDISGVKVIVDSVSLMYLGDTEIEWVEALEGSGFKINNPNASGSCGCGKSFNA